jgi:hypothetical protein
MDLARFFFFLASFFCVPALARKFFTLVDRFFSSSSSRGF